MTMPLGGLLNGHLIAVGISMKVGAGGEVFVIGKKLNIKVLHLNTRVLVVGPRCHQSQVGGGKRLKLSGRFLLFPTTKVKLVDLSCFVRRVRPKATVHALIGVDNEFV